MFFFYNAKKIMVPDYRWSIFISITKNEWMEGKWKQKWKFSTKSIFISKVNIDLSFLNRDREREREKHFLFCFVAIFAPNEIISWIIIIWLHLILATTYMAVYNISRTFVFCLFHQNKSSGVAKKKYEQFYIEFALLAYYYY